MALSALNLALLLTALVSKNTNVKLVVLLQLDIMFYLRKRLETKKENLSTDDIYKATAFARSNRTDIDTINRTAEPGKRISYYKNIP